MGQAQVSLINTPHLSTYPLPSKHMFTQKTNNWMKNIDGDTYVSDIHIPGTHQSLSREGGFAFLMNMAQCQTWSLEDQLKSGIRCFDIRGKCVDGKFLAYHGIIDQELVIDEAIQSFYNFLEQNPSECLIVMIKYEGKIKQEVMTQIFEKLIGKYKNKYWYMQNKVPQLSEVRKKIIFVPRWKYGHGLTNYKTQDLFNVKISKKQSEIEKIRLKSVKDFCLIKGNYLQFNYLSGSTIFNWPLSYAEECNKQYYENPQGKGIIMIDFPGEYLIDKIIHENFREKDIAQLNESTTYIIGSESSICDEQKIGDVPNLVANTREIKSLINLA